EQSIEIRPLTILAGANSSGKSSMMQPLLLLKQTLEASYDPGALRLDGPNVRFTSTDQFLSHAGKGKHVNDFHVGIDVIDVIDVEESNSSSTVFFHRRPNRTLEVRRMISDGKDGKIDLKLGMSNKELVGEELLEDLKDIRLTVVQDRCFLKVEVMPQLRAEIQHGRTANKALIRAPPRITEGLQVEYTQGEQSGTTFSFPMQNVKEPLRELIHLPGLRGNPERTYLVAAVGSNFTGTFENYSASVIAKWQADKNNRKIEELGQDLKSLGLTWKVLAKSLNDTQVELQVGRLPQPLQAGKSDMVSIADVGVGVSQTLPVLVALHVAKPGQLVYIEQPEIHLHPRAQTAMAQILANAARRGVRVVVETHSSLLILGIQTLVAERTLAPELVKLHWFERRNGRTEITSRDLDETGAFGDWPEDFADVALEAQSRYLDAAESRMRSKRRAS
ncbi:MAG: AAA family ATPase, partial [Pyrinomonadaceae bacterium]